MKLHYLLLLIIPYWFVQPSNGDPIDKTAELIRRGDVKELSAMFASSIELTILEEENVYTKSQAESILNNFFQHNQPTAIKILHRVGSNPNYRFAVLVLTTRNGAYRASFSLKSLNGQFILNELRIEAEKVK